MANVSRIRGFVPAKSLIGAPWQSLVRQYKTDGAQTSAIFIGDAITLDTDGFVKAAANTDTIVGVAIAIGKETTTFGETGYFNPDDLGQRSLAALTVGVIGVVPAEGVVYNVFVTLDATIDRNIGDENDFLVTAGDPISGNSNYTLASTTAAPSLKIVERNTKPNNDTTIANGEYLVMFTTTENSQA